MADDPAFLKKQKEWQKQLQKIAEGKKKYEELMALDNISFDSDDDDLSDEGNSNQKLELEKVQGIKNSEPLRECLEQSKMIFTEWQRTHTIATAPKQHGIASQKDMDIFLEKFKNGGKAEVTVINAALMTVGEFDILGHFRSALNYMCESSMVEKDHYESFPFDIIFAWISCAAQCEPTLLAPPNELAGSSISAYLNANLNVSFLPEVSYDRIEMASSKISRVFEILSVIDMNAYTASELSLIVYAAAKLMLDEKADVTFQSQAISVFSNIFGLENKSKIMHVSEEIAQLFPLLSADEPRAICSFMDTAIMSECPDYFCISIFCSYLVYVTGRSECTPDKINTNMSDTEIADMYIGLMCSLFEDGLSLYEEVSKQWALINSFSSSLNPDMLRSASSNTKKVLEEKLEYLKKRFFSNGRSDHAVIEYQVRDLLQRVKGVIYRRSEGSSADNSFVDE